MFNKWLVPLDVSGNTPPDDEMENSRNVLRRYLDGSAPAGEPFPLLVGLPGSGKTSMVRDIIEDLKRQEGCRPLPALFEIHAQNSIWEDRLPDGSWRKDLHRLVRQSINHGRQPVLLLNDLASPAQMIPTVYKLRQELPSETRLVATTSDLTAMAASPDSSPVWKPVPCVPTLSGWAHYERARHPFSPHSDLLDVAVAYLHKHPSHAWPGAMSGTIRPGVDDIRPDDFVGRWKNSYRPSPRDWTLALNEHATFLCLTALRGDEGAWKRYISEIYQRYLPGPVGRQFTDFMNSFRQESLPTATQILLDGAPPRLGWRHPSTLPELADEMGRTLLKVLNVSEHIYGKSLPHLTCFAHFINDLARYGQYLSHSPINPDPSAGADLSGIDLLQPNGSRTGSALMDRAASALRAHVPSIRERLEPLAAAGFTLPAPLSELMPPTVSGGLGDGFISHETRSTPSPARPPFRPGFYR